MTVLSTWGLCRAVAEGEEEDTGQWRQMWLESACPKQSSGGELVRARRGFPFSLTHLGNPACSLGGALQCLAQHHLQKDGFRVNATMS